MTTFDTPNKKTEKGRKCFPNAFNLDKAKILSSGKGLSVKMVSVWKTAGIKFVWPEKDMK